MKKKNITAALMAVLLSFGLSGCGENQIPAMTADELQAVGEYAAITLMKYDASRRSRLVELPEESISPIYDSYEPEITKPEEPSEMKPADDTPVVNSQGGGADSSYTIEEVMELPDGISVSYRGYELCDYYPYDEEESYFAVQAAQGKKLLVLQFSITNNSGREQNVDLLSSGMVYRITVNETVTRQALLTMLMDDMTTYADIIPADGSAEVVLVAEVEDSMAAELTSVNLKLKNGSKTCTIQLF